MAFDVVLSVVNAFFLAVLYTHQTPVLTKDSLQNEKRTQHNYSEDNDARCQKY